MEKEELIRSIDLVNARGQLLQVAVSLDWRVIVDGNRDPYFTSVDGLCLAALASRPEELVTAEQMSETVLEVHEHALDMGAKPNTLVQDQNDYFERFSKSIGRLAMRKSPLFDNVFTIFNRAFSERVLLLKNFDEISPENDRRQKILESVKSENLSDVVIGSLNKSLDREYRTRAKRAAEHARIDEINLKKSGLEPEARQTTVVVNVVADPESRSERVVEQKLEAKTPQPSTRKKSTSRTKKTDANPQKEFTPVKPIEETIEQKVAKQIDGQQSYGSKKAEQLLQQIHDQKQVDMNRFLEGLEYSGYSGLVEKEIYNMIRSGILELERVKGRRVLVLSKA